MFRPLIYFLLRYYRMSEQERGRGIESEVEVGYTSLCLDAARQYLGQSCKDYGIIFQGIEGVQV